MSVYVWVMERTKERAAQVDDDMMEVRCHWGSWSLPVVSKSILSVVGGNIQHGRSGIRRGWVVMEFLCEKQSERHGSPGRVVARLSFSGMFSPNFGRSICI